MGHLLSELLALYQRQARLGSLAAKISSLHLEPVGVVHSRQMLDFLCSECAVEGVLSEWGAQETAALRTSFRCISNLHSSPLWVLCLYILLELWIKEGRCQVRGCKIQMGTKIHVELQHMGHEDPSCHPQSSKVACRGAKSTWVRVLLPSASLGGLRPPWSSLLICRMERKSNLLCYFLICTFLNI
jgi:hypothetical protein